MADVEKAAVIVKEVEVEVKPENITDLPTDQGKLAKFDSLFDNETVSDAELKGEDESSQEKKPADSESSDAKPKPKEEGAEAKKPDEAKPGDEVKPEDEAAKAEAAKIEAAKAKEAEEKAKAAEIEGKPVEGEEEEKKVPPKGYVDLRALQQERQTVSDLKSEIATLQAQINKDVKEVELEAAKVDQDELKVLSDEEFEDLLEDDPDAATLYERKLRQKESKERAEIKAKDGQAQAAQAEAKAINGFVAEIETAVPGIYDEGKEVMKKLVDHAEAKGFDLAHLNAMTNPATKFILPGSKKAFLMGKGAASLVTFLQSSLTAENTNDGLRAKLLEEVRAEVKEENKEYLKKFQNDAGGVRFIGDIPGDGGEIDDKGTYSEKDFHEMTPEAEKKALGG